MLHLLWLIPALPIMGFLALTFLDPRLSRTQTALIGAGSVGLSALVTLAVGLSFVLSPPANEAFNQHLWTWINVSGFNVRISFHLDALALVMIAVVTFVGFLIHVYSVEFMWEEENYSRFFAYLNLFVGSMLTLLLADNLLLLYLGWEGVGLCSFLLIGFWYRDPANGRAARKAFIVTRIGDTIMVIGLFILYDHLGTLTIQDLMQRASAQWTVGSGVAVAVTLMLLAGAVGKSAQLPLQIWLPDAMAGPTPVSALIHAATMVTAGVYLIARTHVLFSLAPDVMTLVAVIGTLTLILAGFSALVQHDIKRVLAYSTMSQIGYMFLALGVGAWSAAIFHFMTHAFFKALLFLGAGVIISRLDHEHDMFKMGGLRKELPLTFWTFLIGASSLAALPLVTAGFYSKDQILWLSYASTQGSVWLWAGGIVGALLTSIYTFRMVFLTFFGTPHAFVKKRLPLAQPGWRIQAPLVILAGLSVVGGLVDWPNTFGHVQIFSDYMHKTLPATSLAGAGTSTEWLLQIIAMAVALGGVAIAYVFFLRTRRYARRLAASSGGKLLHEWWLAGWGFDWLDNELFVQPFLWLSRRDKNDFIDRFNQGIRAVMIMLNRDLSRTQTGRLRWYTMGLVIGAVGTLAMVVLL